MGTLTAAQQAELLGIRGLAFSTPVDDEQSDFSLIEPWVERALEVLLSEDGPRLVNVDFPRSPRGLCWTSQAVDHYDGKIVPGEDPMGRRLYWFTVVPIERVREGTDLWAMEQGFVSLTPLRLDLTHHEQLASMRAGNSLDQPVRTER
jgi:5'-nucleotidase